jgi:ribosomal protein S18 acetylase RimI-like enzyme
MSDALSDAYVATTVERWRVVRHPGQSGIDEPGVRGLLACATEPRTRLLITDDRAYDLLAALLPDARAGTVKLFPAAARCATLFGKRPAWRSKSETAMVCRDLRAVPRVALPGELTLNAVRRLAADAADGVPLEDAAAAALLADPGIAHPADAFGDLLRSWPPPVRLFAAVDVDGVVRATSGAGAFGTYANVVFVNTDPAWRGRGIGRAMTAAALRDAERRGARQAALDATDAGRSTYRQLGFEVVARITQFSRVD